MKVNDVSVYATPWYGPTYNWNNFEHIKPIVVPGN